VVARIIINTNTMQKQNKDEAKTKMTVDHDQIKKWAEERRGAPAMIRGTDETGGALRIDFGENEVNLAPVSWEEFFDAFDDRGLVFLYQEKTPEGKLSRFYKFSERDEADHEIDVEEEYMEIGLDDEA